MAGWLQETKKFELESNKNSNQDDDLYKDEGYK
jgi:hypothetical protein